MFSEVLKNQKMLCPSDSIDVTGSRVLDTATGQPWVVLDLRNASVKFACMRFLVPNLWG